MEFFGNSFVEIEYHEYMSKINQLHVEQILDTMEWILPNPTEERMEHFKALRDEVHGGAIEKYYTMSEILCSVHGGHLANVERPYYFKSGVIDIPIADDHIYIVDGSERLATDNVKIHALNSTALVAIKINENEVDHVYQELSTHFNIENPRNLNGTQLLVDIPDSCLMQDGIWKIKEDVKQVLMEL